MNIIYRYLIKEVSQTLLVVVLILVSIFLSNQLVRYLGEAVSGQIPGQALASILLLSIPQLFALLLPMALFVAILLVLGRWYSDSELIALMGCGFSTARILSILMRYSLVIFAVMCLMNFYLVPKVLALREQVGAYQTLNAMVDTLLPGRFRASPDGNRVFYIARLARDRSTLKELFVAQRDEVNIPEKTKPKPVWNVLVALQGKQQFDNFWQAKYVVAKHGQRFLGVPGRADYRIAKFEEYGIQVGQVNNTITSQDESTLSSTSLYYLQKTHAPRLVAEWQWRWIVALSVFPLVLLSVPAAKILPRAGRYSNLLMGAVLLVTYADMMFVGRAWVQKAAVTSFFGMWWILIVLLLLALIFWSYQLIKARLKT
jgi:lipopolysaccharide export system permease protein